MGNKLVELLGTEDKAKQVEAVQDLIRMAQAPTIVATLVLDTRTERMNFLLNGNFTFEHAYTLLELARKELLRRERAAMMRGVGEEAPKKETKESAT